MKLIVVLSLEACADDLVPVYRDLGIPVFSETDIRGFYLRQAVAAPDNWFGLTDPPAYSKLTFAFVEDEQAGRLLDAIRVHNETHGRPHPVRAFTLNVEQHV